MAPVWKDPFVERSFACLQAYKRLRTRYELPADIYLGLLQLACALICHRRLTRSYDRIPMRTSRRGRWRRARRRGRTRLRERAFAKYEQPERDGNEGAERRQRYSNSDELEEETHQSKGS